MYYVYKLTFGSKELLGSFEDKGEACRFEDEMRKAIRKGKNSDGVFADVTIWSDEDLARMEEDKAFWDSLTDEDRHDLIEVNGKQYVRKAYERRYKK